MSNNRAIIIVVIGMIAFMGIVLSRDLQTTVLITLGATLVISAVGGLFKED